MIFHLPPILLLLSYFLNLLHAMTFNGFQIRDLDTNNDNFFLVDASGFTPTALRNGNYHSICLGTYLVGGYDILGYPNTPGGVQGFNFAKTYFSLPPHQIIYYTITLWLLDFWLEPDDTFQLQFDRTVVQGWSMSIDVFPSYMCGDAGSPDLQNLMVFGTISHSASTLTLKIISQLNADARVKSLGFRDINLLFGSTGPTGVNQRCGLSPIMLPSGECPCPLGQYMDGSCQPCDSSCYACFGGSSAECYQCAVGYSFIEDECIQCSTDCEVCTGPNSNECIRCLPGLALMNDGTCSMFCPYTAESYDNTYGSATVCDSPCSMPQYYHRLQTCESSCDYPMLFNILASGAWVCLHPCETGGFYFPDDNTCSSFCPSPLKQTTLSGVLICENPCQASEYLYWDGSCNEFCEDPLISGTDSKGNQFCKPACVSETDYIYSNRSCLASCEPPFLAETVGNSSYCNVPCGEDQFVLENDGEFSCIDNCSSPYLVREKDDILYCSKPCESSEYLFGNGTCGSSCPAPYSVSETESGIQFCYFMCEHFGEYYYPVEGECFPTCDPPLKAKIMIDDGPWYMACVESEGNFSTVVVLPPEQEVNEREENFIVSKPRKMIDSVSGGVVNVGVMMSVGLSSAMDSSVMGFILMSKILNFMRYLDIDYPVELEEGFLKKKKNFYLNFGPTMWGTLKRSFSEGELPDVFVKYDGDMSSSFLVNFFKPLSSCLILLALVIIFTIMKKIIVVKSELAKIIMRRIELLFKWNMIVFLLICNIDEIVFYSIVEYKTMAGLNSFPDWASFSVSFLMIIVGLAVVATPFYLLHKIYQTRLNVLSNRSNDNLLKSIEGLKPLWVDYKEISLAQRGFFSLYIARMALISMMVGLLDQFPLVQSGMFLALNVAMLCYIIIVKPHRKNVDFIQTISYEVFMLIVSISLLMLVLFDQGVEQLRIFNGDVILFCNTMINFTALVFLVIKISIGINYIWRAWKTRKMNSWSEFIITHFKEDDLVSQQLGRNQKASISRIEKDIQKKIVASPSSQETPSSLSGLIDSPQSTINLSSRKNLKRSKPSLFSLERQKMDSETSVGSIILNKEGLCVDDSKEPVNVRVPRKIRERLERMKLSQGVPLEKPDQKVRDLETIRELSSFENIENRMKMMDPNQEENSPLILENQGLSQAIEKMGVEEKIRRSNNLRKNKRVAEKDPPVVDKISVN